MSKKSNRKGKKGNKSKTKKIPFRLLDIPTELIKHICGILVDQNRKRSLATINVANKFLREATMPYLWGTVRWTKQTWNPDVYFTKGMPEMFVHVRSIVLVSADEGDQNYGWSRSDADFWAPLVSAGFHWSPNATVGQVAHLLFPKLKYVVCLAVPPTREESLQTGDLAASIYLSDQNVVEINDTTAVQRSVFDALSELHRGKDVPDRFGDIDLASGSLVRIEGLGRPGVSETVAQMRELLGAKEMFHPVEMAIVDSELFRRLVIVAFDDTQLNIHLITQTSIEAMEGKVRGKAFDLFRMIKTLAAKDRPSDPRGDEYHS